MVFGTKFRLEFAPRFERRLKSLDRDAQIRILRELQVLAADPYLGKPLRGRWEGSRSLRIGAYSVIYLVADDKVFLLTVGHRKGVYE